LRHGFSSLELLNPKSWLEFTSEWAPQMDFVVTLCDESARVDAVEQVSQRSASLATARRRYETLVESLDAAEQALEAADEALDLASRTAAEIDERVAAATAALEDAEADCQRLAASTDKSS